MKKMYKFMLALCCMAAGSAGQVQGVAPVPDTPYKAAYSVKYTFNPKWDGAYLQKVVVDSDNSVFILTDKGVYRDFPGNIISKDLMYASLADKRPIDLCIQEGTGELYYLYYDRFLTNRHAGRICGHLTPGAYARLAVNRNDDVLLIGERQGVWQCTMYHGNEKVADFPAPNGQFVKIYVHNTTFWYLTSDAVYRLDGTTWTKVHAGQAFTALAFAEHEITVGTPDGFFVIDDKGKLKKPKENRLPVPAITNMLTVGGHYWFATDNGAFMQDGDKYCYYAYQRWLDDKAIVDMAADGDGNLYFLTPTGLNKVGFRDETLAGKAETIHRDLRKYHLRFGFSAEAKLLDPSDPTSLQLQDSDNDGLWSSFYLGSQAFRYAVTGEEDARRYVWETFEAYERLISIHDVKGFSGRTFERTGYYVSDPRAWRPAPDPDWWWKGTTSTDEFVAYLFIVAVIDEFVARTPDEKRRVADYFDAIMTHIISNNYYFIDVDGQPTLWGRWNPEYVNSFATTQFDRRLNSTLTITGLQLAYKLTGKEIYKTEAYRMMNDHGYLNNMKIPMKEIRYTPGFVHQGHSLGQEWNHSDDEMAFLTYWALYHYAFDDKLKKEYANMIRDHWEIEKPERNGLWNLLAYGTSGDFDLESTLWYLRGFPADTRRYTVRNVHRKDLTFLSSDPKDNFRHQSTTELIPKSERPMNRHNANEFSLNSNANGREILAGDEYLLPYWLARYLKVIE